MRNKKQRASELVVANLSTPTRLLLLSFDFSDRRKAKCCRSGVNHLDDDSCRAHTLAHATVQTSIFYYSCLLTLAVDGHLKEKKRTLMRTRCKIILFN